MSLLQVMGLLGILTHRILLAFLILCFWGVFPVEGHPKLFPAEEDFKPTLCVIILAAKVHRVCVPVAVEKTFEQLHRIQHAPERIDIRSGFPLLY